MKITIENHEVVIRIPIPTNYAHAPISKSGNNRVLDTTHGFQLIEGTDFKVSVNFIISTKKSSDHIPMKRLLARP